MITRRKFVKISSIAGASFALTSTGWVVNRALAQPLLLDPVSQPKYVNPLPTLSRVATMRAGIAINSEIREEKQFLGLYDAKGIKLKTRIWGYKFGDVDTLLEGDKGIFPGATIIAERDTPVSITWKNKLKEYDVNELEPWQAHLLPIDQSTHIANPTNRKVGVPTVTHLHGGHTESDSDGLPEAWFTRDFKEYGPDFAKETYLYENDQEAGTLWYHDHALGMTRLNMYAGLSGMYLLRDNNENYLIADSVLPGDPYEKELIIQDRTFSADGQLFLPSANPELEPINPLTDEPFPPLPPGPSIIAEFFGDFILVNGMVWPLLEVEPRKYRFRVLNSSDSRFYILKFSNAMPFLQVGTDQGLLPQAVKLNKLLLSPSERVDIVVDFTNLQHTDIVLRNFGPDEPFEGFHEEGDDIADPATTGQIMLFRVNQAFNDTVAEATVRKGTTLRPPLPSLTQYDAIRQVVLFEGLDDFGRLQPTLGTLEGGSLAWFDPVTENPRLNDVEVWEIYNTTEDAHPIHIHLIAFQIINRESFIGTVIQRPQPQHNGTVGVGAELLASSVVLGSDARPAELNERGWKDTVVSLPGEVTRVITSPFDRSGRYVWHCHIVSHEDHEMMRPFHVG